LLLAKGRNAEFIQNKLWISHHTAKTHVAKIYRKLDVHSTQEMLDLIESFKERPESSVTNGEKMSVL
jgi:DNA-binding CsgD family transcriptional regulator